MAEPLTHDVRIWLTAAQYAGLLRRAHEDDRALSAYVRRLIARDLEESVDGCLPPVHAGGGFVAGRHP